MGFHRLYMLRGSRATEIVLFCLGSDLPGCIFASVSLMADGGQTLRADSWTQEHTDPYGLLELIKPRGATRESAWDGSYQLHLKAAL